MTTDRRTLHRALLLVPGGFALLAGIDAALILLGLPAPIETTRLTEVHGILLVLGFVGTVVALERAVAAHRWWTYLSPAFLGAGAALLWLGSLPVPDLLPWLSGFLILTIIGERLELARVAMLGTRAEALLGVVAVAIVAGTVAALL